LRRPVERKSAFWLRKMLNMIAAKSLIIGMAVI